jgi:hypothetical protein
MLAQRLTKLMIFRMIASGLNKFFIIIAFVGFCAGFQSFAPNSLSNGAKRTMSLSACSYKMSHSASGFGKKLSAAFAASLLLGGPMLPSQAVNVANPYARVSLK